MAKAIPRIIAATLELDPDEVDFLARLLGYHVTGEGPMRDISDRIGDALSGLPGGGTHDPAYYAPLGDGSVELKQE